jgi:protein-tyrosine-phosphatase
LLEINGRPWGSLPLAVFAGVDFPTIFYRTFVDGDSPPSWPGYRVGVRSRLLHADLKLLALRTVRAIKDPSAVLPWVRHLGSFLNVLTGREACDVEKPHDLRPALALWGQKLRGLWSEIGQRMDLLIRKVWLRVRRRSPRRRKHVEELLKRAHKVLFVCQGNICRSPYAEGCLRSTAHGLLEVQSRGLSSESGRKPPPTARAVARERGVDLERHCSQAVDDPAVQWADMVIAMDVKMLQDLRRRFPRAVHKTLLASEIVSDRPFPLEIPDPWAAGREEYERVFDLMRLLAGQLASRRLSA